ncbi:hypothetical protein Y032_0030g2218 [Ancylostoma ceylanicum]|uniref:PB1 domain-containing protein n=1 Tax=Ancylostoma ceylanicum TaxID=53326 RepID=A0A016UR76_9BILA|nr:hypothetical protein Y032_0030g2218 [Ancylostoma ceylanicum]
MANEEKSAIFKLLPAHLPRITFTYKDKWDFLERFEKKLKELKLPIRELYWSDWEKHRTLVKTLDDVFEAVENNQFLKMYYISTGHRRGLFARPGSDEDGGERGKQDVSDDTDCRGRSPTPTSRKANIKFCSYNAPRLTIAYRDEKDLFEKFKRKLRALHIPIARLYWNDWENDRIPIEDADDLMYTVTEQKDAWENSRVKLYYCCNGNSRIFDTSDSETEEEEGERT